VGVGWTGVAGLSGVCLGLFRVVLIICSLFHLGSFGRFIFRIFSRKKNSGELKTGCGEGYSG